jgi:hypothetical protein
MKKHRLNPRFPLQRRCSTDHIHHSASPRKASRNVSQKAGLTAWIRYCRDWTSAPHISLRSGMFKRPKVVPITAAKRVSKEQLRKETIPPIRTGMVTRLTIRQMLATARSQETQVPQEKPQAPECSARRRAKILYMPKRSCDDSCNN